LLRCLLLLPLSLRSMYVYYCRTYEKAGVNVIRRNKRRRGRVLSRVKRAQSRLPSLRLRERSLRRRILDVAWEAG